MKKNKELSATLLILLCIFGLTGCINEEKEEERKVTHYEEQTVIVASKKLQGVISSCGTDFTTGVCHQERKLPAMGAITPYFRFRVRKRL